MTELRGGRGGRLLVPLRISKRDGRVLYRTRESIGEWQGVHPKKQKKGKREKRKVLCPPLDHSGPMIHTTHYTTSLSDPIPSHPASPFPPPRGDIYHPIALTNPKQPQKPRKYPYPPDNHISPPFYKTIFIKTNLEILTDSIK